MKSERVRVRRTKGEARESYDKISRFYDCFTVFESKYNQRALDLLCIRMGETVLEIGFGTGRCLKRIAESVGETGKACGIDISTGMLDVTRKMLGKLGLKNRVELCCGDASQMPYADDVFDVVFMGFTLELFDTPEIPIVLEETRRILKSHGRVGVVSMSNENGESLLLKIYIWAHQKIPKYVDCRPIHVRQSIRKAGYEIKCSEEVKLFGLPAEIVIGINK